MYWTRHAQQWVRKEPDGRHGGEKKKKRMTKNRVDGWYGVKEATNKSIEELKEMAQNRHKWRLFIRRVSEGRIRLNAH